MGDTGYLYDLLRRLGFDDFAARSGEFLLLRPLRIVLVLVAALVVARIASRLLARAVRSVRVAPPLSTLGELSPRVVQRTNTIAEVLSSLVRVVVFGVALFVILDELGVNLAPLLAGAGVAGLAVGFGAQTLVRDVLSGLFVLMEDQYGVGDQVVLGDATGTVEDVTLRVTRLRGTDGTVWFVPNGEVRRVGNTSMEWSQALVDVEVPATADLGRVSNALAEEAQALAADPRFAQQVLDVPEVQGIQALSTETATLRVALRTSPRQQHVVARELRGRVAERLRREGVLAPA